MVKFGVETCFGGVGDSVADWAVASCRVPGFPRVAGSENGIVCSELSGAERLQPRLETCVGDVGESAVDWAVA